MNETERTELRKIHSGKYQVFFDGVKVGHVSYGKSWSAWDNYGHRVTDGQPLRDFAVGVLLRKEGLVKIPGR